MAKYLVILGLLLALPPVPSANSEAHALGESTAVMAVGAPVADRIVTVTAYSSTPEETDDTPFITASGTHVREGVVAANFLPFGTTITIPELYGDRIFVVEDRMHERYPDEVDIWMPTKAEAVRFGKQTARIVVIH